MATPRISRMGVSRWGGPSRRTRGIPPALFSMATRPIRQPPATKTDLPCVPRLIFLLSASTYSSLLVLLLVVVLLSSSSSSTTTSFTIVLLQPFFVSLLPLSRSFFPDLVTHTRLHVHDAQTLGRKGEREEAKPRETTGPLFLFFIFFCFFVFFFLSVALPSIFFSLALDSLLLKRTYFSSRVVVSRGWWWNNGGETTYREKREVPSILPTTDTTPSARLIRTWRL